MRRKTIINSTLIILTFLVALYGRRIAANFIDLSFSSALVNVIYFYAWWVIPTLSVLGILYGFNNIFNEVGLSHGILSGFLFAVITVSPMLLSSAIMGRIDENLKINSDSEESPYHNYGGR